MSNDTDSCPAGLIIFVIAVAAIVLGLSFMFPGSDSTDSNDSTEDNVVKSIHTGKDIVLNNGVVLLKGTEIDQWLFNGDNLDYHASLATNILMSDGFPCRNLSRFIVKSFKYVHRDDYLITCDNRRFKIRWKRPFFGKDHYIVRYYR